MDDHSIVRALPKENDVTNSTDRLADRIEINDLLARYATMVDFRKWNLHDQVFSHDATADYVSSGGISGTAVEVMSWLDRALAPWPVNLHLVTNIVVEFTGAAEAESTCYFMGPLGVGELGAQHVIMNAGLYVDRLRRDEAGWRITHREMRQTLMIGELPEGYVIPD